MIADPKFFERAEKFMLFKDTEGKYYTIEEYKKLIEENQKNKDNRLVYLYATNADEQYSNIENAKNKGYNVLLMDGILDSHFISTYEQKFGDCHFARVDSASIDKLIEKEGDSNESKLNDEQKENIKKAFENVIDKVTFNVEFSNLGENDAPVEIIQNEFMRRMKDMSAMGGGMQMWGSMPDNYILMLNTNNPIIAGLADKSEEEQANTIKHLYDLARLSKNLLKGKDLNEFVKRSFNEI